MDENDRVSGGAGVQAPMADGRRGEGSPGWHEGVLSIPRDALNAVGGWQYQKIVFGLYGMAKDNGGRPFRAPVRLLALEFNTSIRRIRHVVSTLKRDGFASTFSTGGPSRAEHIQLHLSPVSPQPITPPRGRVASIVPEGCANSGVYAVEAVGTDRVKIGFSTNIRRRVVELSIGCPVPLRLLSVRPGGAAEETDLHERLSGDRLHGEWFTLSDHVRWVLAPWAIRGRGSEGGA